LGEIDAPHIRQETGSPCSNLRVGEKDSKASPFQRAFMEVEEMQLQITWVRWLGNPTSSKESLTNSQRR